MADAIKDRQRPDGYRDTLPGFILVPIAIGREEVIQLLSLAGKSRNKKAFKISQEGFLIKDRQRLTLPGFILVPSALVGLTSLFGMGRGDPRRYSHLKILALAFSFLLSAFSFFDMY